MKPLKFECANCQRKFMKKTKLREHLSSHSDVRVYRCEICNKAFKLNYQLTKHKKYVHTEERPFKCYLCNASFKRSFHLKVHAKTHEKDKKLKKDVCVMTSGNEYLEYIVDDEY